MGVLDFLFQGSPPPSTTTYGTSVANIPQFMTDYTLGLLNKATAVAGKLYEPYGGPRLAQFTPEQQQSFEQTKKFQGAYAPVLQTGMEMTNLSGQANIPGAAAPYMALSGLAAPDIVGAYMNPYTSSVVNRIGQLAGRNLRENLMPAINTNFIRAGQFGSAGQQSAIGRALRDVQESALAQQTQALAGGYGAATTAAQADLARQAQLAQLAGSQAAQQAQTQLAAGQQLGQQAQVGQTMGYKDIAALEAAGQTQQQEKQKNLDLAYQDFLRQQAYPAQQLGMLNALIRGLPYSQTSETSSTGPASIYQPSPLSQVIGGLSLTKALGLKKGGPVKRNPNRRSTRGKGRR